MSYQMMSLLVKDVGFQKSRVMVLKDALIQLKQERSSTYLLTLSMQQPIIT